MMRDENGNISYSAILFCSLLALVEIGMAVALFRAWKKGRILFGWYDAYVTLEHYVDREKTPIKFLLVSVMYCISMALLAGLFIWVAFGRASH